MGSVLIVDDEIPSRELLKLGMDWKEAGFDPVLEARNGREALALFHERQPALIITDIQMPVMDGLEFIRAVRQHNPQQKIIILSCHESFSYAKEAMKLGVSDYLLKDALTGETLRNTVLATISSRGTPASMTTEDDAALRMALSAKATPAAACERLAAALGTSLDFFACVARFEVGVLSSGFYIGLCAELSDVLRESGGGQVCATKDSLYTLVYLQKTPSAAGAMRVRAELVARLRSVLERRFGLFATIGVSRAHSRANELCAALREANEALGLAVFLGKGRDLYYTQAASQDSREELRLLDGCVERVKQALAGEDEEAVCAEIRNLYQRELCGMMRLRYLEHVNALLLGVLIQSCASGEIPYAQVFDSDIITLEALEQSESILDMCAWYEARFRALLEAQRRERSPRLARILAYLAEHFREDIGLDSVAETFHMHKVYLAKVFKNETGLSVNEHIRYLRMEEAKRLLSQRGVRVGEVVERLGFNNPQTFYQMFKRYAGMSPGEYKEQCELKRIDKTINGEAKP